MAFGMNFRGGAEQMPSVLEAFSSRLTTVWGRQHDNAGGHVFPEGNWTPTLAFGGQAVGIVYALQTARVIQVGRLVFVSCRIDVSNKGSSTGTATLGGLPVLATAYSSFDGAVIASGMSGLTSPITAQVAASGGGINLFDWGAAGVAVLDDTNFTNTSVIIVTIAYVAAE